MSRDVVKKTENRTDDTLNKVMMAIVWGCFSKEVGRTLDRWIKRLLLSSRLASWGKMKGRGGGRYNVRRNRVDRKAIVLHQKGGNQPKAGGLSIGQERMWGLG